MRGAAEGAEGPYWRYSSEGERVPLGNEAPNPEPERIESIVETEIAGNLARNSARMLRQRPAI